MARNAVLLSPATQPLAQNIIEGAHGIDSPGGLVADAGGALVNSGRRTISSLGNDLLDDGGEIVARESGVLVRSLDACPAPKEVGRPHLPAHLPDDAPVIRGGQSLPDNYVNGSGVTVGEGGLLDGVSVQSSGYNSWQDLASEVPHRQVGITTVGDVRRAGGDVIPSPTPRNPNHGTLSGLTGEDASMITRPTIRNPNPKKR